MNTADLSSERQEYETRARELFDRIVATKFVNMAKPTLEFVNRGDSKYDHAMHRITVGHDEVDHFHIAEVDKWLAYAQVVTHELVHAKHAEKVKARGKYLTYGNYLRLRWHTYGGFGGFVMYKGKFVTSNDEYLKLPHERLADTVMYKWLREFGVGDFKTRSEMGVR